MDENEMNMIPPEDNGMVYVEDENGCYRVSEDQLLDPADEEEILGRPLTELEAAALYEDTPPISDDEIDFLVAAAEATEDGLCYAASCWDSLTDQEKQMIFTEPMDRCIDCRHCRKLKQFNYDSGEWESPWICDLFLTDDSGKYDPDGWALMLGTDGYVHNSACEEFTRRKDDERPSEN